MDQALPKTIPALLSEKSFSRLAAVINTEFNGYLNLLLLFI